MVDLLCIKDRCAGGNDIARKLLTELHRDLGCKAAVVSALEQDMCCC